MTELSGSRAARRNLSPEALENDREASRRWKRENRERNREYQRRYDKNRPSGWERGKRS